MTRRMRVLVACERFGAVRDAFRNAGHDAWSCDLEGVEPYGEWPNYHLYGDCRWFLDGTATYAPWDMLIAFPPCTYLSSSGLHWNKRIPGRAAKTEEALELVRALIKAPIERIAIENPEGCIGTRLAEQLAAHWFREQLIQPHQFGHDASKATRLRLKNLPQLRHAQHVAPRIVNGKKRWANQTDSGQNRLGPSETRAAERGKTYPGIAAAMAQQWGRL